MAIVDGNAGSSMAQSAVTPVQGVQGPNVAGQVANLFSGLGQLYGQKKEIDARNSAIQQEATANSVVSEFRGNQIRIAQAVQTGQIKAGRAQTLLNANLAAAISKYGSLGEDIMKAHKSIMTTEGLGTAVTEQTPEERQELALIDVGTDLGISFKDSDTEQEYQKKLDMVRQHQASIAKMDEATRAHEERMRKLNLEGKIVSNESAEFDLAKKKNTKAVGEALTSSAETYMPILSEKLLEIRTQYDAGSIDGKTAALLTKEAWANVETILRNTAGTEFQSQAEALTSPMKGLYDLTLSYVNSVANIEELENTKKLLITKMQVMALQSDPELQATVALSNLFGNALLAEQGLSAQTAVTRFIKSVVEGKPTDLPNNPERDTIVKLGKDFIKDNNATDEEKAGYLQGIFKDFSKYGATVDSPEQLHQLMQLSASPEFIDFVKRKPEVLSEISPQLRETIQEYYQGPVLESIKKGWEKGVSVQTEVQGEFFATTNTRPYTNLVEPYFTATGVSFRPKQGEDSAASNKAVRILNQQITPKLNTLLKAGAHMEGHTDYEKMFTDNYQQIFGVLEEAPQPEG